MNDFRIRINNDDDFYKERYHKQNAELILILELLLKQYDCVSVAFVSSEFFISSMKQIDLPAQDLENMLERIKGDILNHEEEEEEEEE